jgi:hypothetical protein
MWDLVVFSLSFRIIWDNAEAAQYDHLLLWPFLPVIRMPMSIPVIQCCLQGFAQFIQRFETPALERQGAYLLPPRLNQVQPAGVLRNELNLNL